MWYGNMSGSMVEVEVAVGAASLASSEGMKRVAVRGSVEGSAEERRSAHPPKSPVPMRASIMLFSCCRCSLGGGAADADAGGNSIGGEASGGGIGGDAAVMVGSSRRRRRRRRGREIAITEGEGVGGFLQM